jgi:hypothetical protein
MISRVCLLILSLYTIAGAEYDDNILWRYSFASGNSGYSVSPDNVCQTNYNAIFLHSNPYQLRDLNWDYISAKAGYGKWGLSAAIRSYRLTDLYNDMMVSIAGALRLTQQFYFALGTSFGREKFGNTTEYDRADMNLHAVYLIKPIAIHGGLDRVCLKKPYQFYNKSARPFVVCNLTTSECSVFSAGYKQIEPERGRWLLSQDLSVSSNLSLSIAYLTYPDLLQCGLDLRWKKITFSAIYQGIDKLDDTIIWGLSIGK